MGVSTIDRQQKLVAELLTCDGSGVIYPGLTVQSSTYFHINGCLIPKPWIKTPLHELVVSAVNA
jgi:hypothetical protein